MTNSKKSIGSISAADEVAMAEANLKAAQERLNAARHYYVQESLEQPPSPADDNFGANGFENDSIAQPQCVAASHAGGVVGKRHVTAGLLAIFMGAFGIHKFYLGFVNTGFIVLGITIVGSLLSLGAAALVMQLIAIVEGIIYLAKPQSQFERDYVQGQRKWL